MCSAPPAAAASRLQSLYHMRSPRAPILLALLALAAPAGATPQTMALAPPAAEIGLRIWGMGLLPLDFAFGRFGGTLAFDPERPGACRVELAIEAASLAGGDASVRDHIVSAEFLDAARFPRLAYRGDCATGRVAGALTMHGETHPLALVLEADRTRLVATGELRRAEWGMTARPLMGGSTIRIRVSLPLTAALASALEARP
jgi:polyisoprenoid-binding protein YceI